MAEKALVTPQIREVAAQREAARQEVADWIRRATSVALAALLGAAVGLSLSVVFLSAGVVLALFAIPVAALGMVAHFVLPPILAGRRIRQRGQREG